MVMNRTSGTKLFFFFNTVDRGLEARAAIPGGSASTLVCSFDSPQASYCNDHAHFTEGKADVLCQCWGCGETEGKGRGDAHGLVSCPGSSIQFLDNEGTGLSATY